EAQEAKRVGVDIRVERIDWDLIQRRMWSQIDESKEINESLSHIPNLTVYRGVGEFVGDYEMRVRLNDGTGYSQDFKGKRIVIASGARSAIPPIKGFEDVGYVTSDSFFGPKFPKNPWKSLVIIGGGVIAVEFAHIFSASGTEVTVVEMLPRLVATEEPEVSEFLKANLVKYMRVYVNSRAVAVRKEDSTKILTIEDVVTGQRRDVGGEEIFVASGRQSNADLLMVQNTGVEVSERGWIRTNEFLETSKKNIWCIGDANGIYQFRHKANYEAEICSINLFASEEERVPVDYSAVPWAIFTYPEVGHVGMTEDEAIKSGHQIYVAIKHYSSVAKGFAMGFNANDVDDGFVKLIVDRNRRILGAHVVGPDASVLVQPFAYLMNAGYVCDPLEDNQRKPMTKMYHSCPESGSLMPIYRSMVIHPSLNEVTAWTIGSLRPVNME
ncbi:FAD-dependent oxidoreductase, partial [Candidatus Bathyarchaeota archaeon]|nr:FAD-dependent oxidoreductase [Candidatus Bathyarchaeota archaeon]